jgi:3-dehydroquinate synthase
VVAALTKMFSRPVCCQILLGICDQARTYLNSRELGHAQDSDKYRVVPVARAPMNVFAFEDSQHRTVGWRNVFRLPVEYSVMFTPDLFDLLNTTLLPDAPPRRRLLVIGTTPAARLAVDDASGLTCPSCFRCCRTPDSEVHRLHGQRMLHYFRHHDVDVTVVLLPGEEHNKRFEAVEKVLAACEKFGLRRREPLVAIGGGVVLDIVGMAANMYRRGVPFIRVPTTLLAIVDASVGVKNGVDYCSACKGLLKNRIGSFYAPIAAYADKSFIATQDERNIVNGLGEIMKLALVRSVELFELLEAHGARLVADKF